MPKYSQDFGDFSDFIIDIQLVGIVRRIGNVYTFGEHISTTNVPDVLRSDLKEPGVRLR